MTCHDYTPGVNTECSDSCACERNTGRSILSEAESLVYGDRGRDYGPPWVDHQRVADIVNAWTGSDLDATDIQRVLVAVKLARMAESPTKRDHYVDAAGYLDCLWRTIERTPDEEPVER